MSVLNHIAQAAAVILLIELLVVIFVFLGIAGGLAFGLRWVRGKTGWAFGKANTYAGMGTGYLHKGMDYAAKPFILAGGWADRVKGTAGSLRDQAREARRRRVEPPGAVPVEEETESLVPLA